MAIEHDSQPVDTSKQQKKQGFFEIRRLKVIKLNATEIIGANIKTSSSQTRIEMNGENNFIGIFKDGNQTISLEDGQIVFLTPEGGLVGFIDVQGSSGNERMVISGLGGLINMQAFFLPYTSNTYDIGVSSTRWRNIFLINSPDVASDAREKENIGPIQHTIEAVKKLLPVSFTRKGSSRKHLGFLAQEVKGVVPEVVTGNEKEGYGLAYEELIPVLTKAIQELAARVDQLERKNV